MSKSDPDPSARAPSSHSSSFSSSPSPFPFPSPVPPQIPFLSPLPRNTTSTLRTKAIIDDDVDDVKTLSKPNTNPVPSAPSSHSSSSSSSPSPFPSPVPPQIPFLSPLPRNTTSRLRTKAIIDDDVGDVNNELKLFVNKHGPQRALVMSAIHGKAKLTEYLLKVAKADPSYNECEAVQEAIKHGHDTVTETFLQDPRIHPSRQNQRLFRMAIIYGRHKVVKLLLKDAYIDPFKLDVHDVTVPIVKGYIHLVHCLLATKCINPNNLHPMMFTAAKHGRLTVVATLIEDFNVQPTAEVFNEACWAKQVGVITHLLQKYNDLFFPEALKRLGDSLNAEMNPFSNNTSARVASTLLRFEQLNPSWLFEDPSTYLQYLTFQVMDPPLLKLMQLLCLRNSWYIHLKTLCSSYQNTVPFPQQVMKAYQGITQLRLHRDYSIETCFNHISDLVSICLSYVPDLYFNMQNIIDDNSSAPIGFLLSNVSIL